MRACETCGTELVRHRKHSNAQWAKKRFCDRQCASKRLVKRRPPCECGCGAESPKGRKWIKGHRSLKLLNGYVRVWNPTHPLAHKNGSVLEHRMLAYDAGWEVGPGFDVHHRNGIKHDNRLENLEVLETAEHARIHAYERGQVTNQHGTFEVITDPARRKAREKAHNRKQKLRREAGIASVGVSGRTRPRRVV